MSEKTESKPKTQTPVRWGLFIAVALAVIAADQVTKFLAVKHLTNAMSEFGAQSFGQELRAFIAVEHPNAVAYEPGSRCVPVVKSFWSHCYAENPGAAFSFARDWPDAIRVPFFHIVTLLAIVMISLYYRKLEPGQNILRAALCLVMGGAVGNLIDRLIRGYVIDFVDWHLNDYWWAKPTTHWPTFNIADVAISVGVGLIVLDSILMWFAQRKATPRTAES